MSAAQLEILGIVGRLRHHLGAMALAQDLDLQADARFQPGLGKRRFELHADRVRAAGDHQLARCHLGDELRLVVPADAGSMGVDRYMDDEVAAGTHAPGPVAVSDGSVDVYGTVDGDVVTFRGKRHPKSDAPKSIQDLS